MTASERHPAVKALWKTSSHLAAHWKHRQITNLNIIELTMYVAGRVETDSYNGRCHHHQNHRLCSRPHSHESVIFFVFLAYEGFYNFSKVCLQFFSFLNVVFSRLFYDNITFQHLFIIIKCPAELNFDCKILIRSVPSTLVTELLLRGYVFLTFP